jgi:hypothetical protein
MQTTRTLEVDLRQVMRGSVSTGKKSSTGRVWVAGFHHVWARSRLEAFKTYEQFFEHGFL